MPALSVLLSSLLLCQTTFNLRGTMLLVFNAKLKFFNFFLQSLILHMEVIDELLHIDALVTSLVHALEQSGHDIVESCPQLFFLFGRHLGQALHALSITCQVQHVLDELFFVDITVLVGIDHLKLLNQVLPDLGQVPFSLDSVRAVNVNVIDIGCHLVRVADRACSASATCSAEGRPRASVRTLPACSAGST